MFLRFKSLASLICLVLSVASAQAGTDSATAEALMRKSGLWNQLSGFAPQIRAGFIAAASTSKQGMSTQEAERIAKVIDSAYSSERLRTASLKVFAAELDEARISPLTRWFDGPLGKKIAKLDIAASEDISDPREQISQGEDLLRSMPKARRAEIEAFVRASHVAELMAEMSIETSVAVVEGVASSAPGASRTPARDLRKMIQAQRPQMEAGLNAMSAAVYARAYNSLSIEEIKRYVRFLKSDAGRHLNAAGTKAVSAAMREGATELGRMLYRTKDKANT